ncbi:hypothetical protein [uncultured Psychroserpens sp.]|uniref:hypothetical protein n=1 Tax=uncultured Psychroserpens sp. TaxID=255436 RepID=UPI0026140F07|nr:hypothetical protein [uncultured Psychroserpens sp.]
MMNQITDIYQKNFINGIRHPHLYLWDSWSYVEDNTIHLYCLAISRHKINGEELNPNERNDFPFHIRHFISKDNGISWKDEGCFMSPQDISSLNYRTIWSGSVELLPNGKKLVAYTGLENIDSGRDFLQSIAIGISNNGFTVDSVYDKVLSSPIRDWKEITEKGYYLDIKDQLGSNLGEEGGPIMSWRDPFIFHDKNGELNLFWAAKVKPRVGAIARATLKAVGDFFEIEQLHTPVTVPDKDDFTQLEVPKVLYDDHKDCYYLIISSCNRLYENQPDSEIKKEMRLYTSKHIDGPWTSLGDKILGEEHLFGLTVLRSDFKNNRLLCIAPYTEAADKDLMLSFAPVFYIYLNPLRVEFLNQF